MSRHKLRYFFDKKNCIIKSCSFEDYVNKSSFVMETSKFCACKIQLYMGIGLDWSDPVRYGFEKLSERQRINQKGLEFWWK